MSTRGPELDCDIHTVIIFTKEPLRDIWQQVNVPNPPATIFGVMLPTYEITP
jgi:hypothetical protein